MSSRKPDKQSRRTTSIARSINRSFWRKRVLNMLLTDGLILCFVCIAFLLFCESQATQMAPEDDIETAHVSRAHYFINDSGSLDYCVKIDTHEYCFNVTVYFPYIRVIIAATLLMQGVHLFFALFHTSEIRRKLKPLNDLAIQAEELMHASAQPDKFESLEHAINRVSPTAPDASVHTGDKDLQSIELALNNLLHRMKETQRQQERFVSDASHELRTPIAVIQGYVNMLDRWGTQDEAVLAESIEALQNETQHMKELVEQLLFLARGDNGKHTLHKTRFDLNALMQEVWEESSMIDDTHCYTFSKCKDAYVQADMAMIKQSMRILVQNASNYSNRGDTIHLGVIRDNTHVCYVVQDEGIGMKNTEVVHIFERFYRSDEARNTESGGSGLGLSIAKWIIDAHEGVIDVLSRSEIGTRFTVRLPSAPIN